MKIESNLCKNNYFLNSDAGNAFVNAAKLGLQLNNKHEAATHYVDAANCFRKCDANGERVQKGIFL